VEQPPGRETVAGLAGIAEAAPPRRKPSPSSRQPACRPRARQPALAAPSGALAHRSRPGHARQNQQSRRLPAIPPSPPPAVASQMATPASRPTRSRHDATAVPASWASSGTDDHAVLTTGERSPARPPTARNMKPRGPTATYGHDLGDVSQPPEPPALPHQGTPHHTSWQTSDARYWYPPRFGLRHRTAGSTPLRRDSSATAHRWATAAFRMNRSLAHPPAICTAAEPATPTEGDPPTPTMRRAPLHATARYLAR